MTSNALTVSHVGQHVQIYDESQIDTLTKTIFRGGTPNQLALFVQVCQRTGLDPFAKQIHPVFRKAKAKDKDGKWVEQTQMTIQVGIDGYRLIAERTGRYLGTTPPEWCGPDGMWTDVWLSDDPPAAARIGIKRADFPEPVYFTALYKEYVQTTDEYAAGERTGNKKPNSMWQKMPANQLRKCAEAGGFRTAFPQECSGVYVDAEDGAGDTVWEAQVEREREPVRTIAAPRATDEEPAETFEGEFSEDANDDNEEPEPATAPQPGKKASVLDTVREAPDNEEAPAPAAPRRARNIDAPQPPAETPPAIPTGADAAEMTFAEFVAGVDDLLAEMKADWGDLGMVLSITPDQGGLKKWWDRRDAKRVPDPLAFIRRNINAMRGE